LLESVKGKDIKTIDRDVIGFLYGWRESMLRDVKQINKLIPTKKSDREQMEMDINDLIDYCENIGIGSYSDPHYSLKVQRRLKQHRLRLREDDINLNCNSEKEIARITNMVGEVDPDDSADEEIDNDEDGYGVD
jgi:hypothetical protein